MISGARTNKRYGGQDVWFPKSKKEQFNGTLTKPTKFTTVRAITEKHRYSDEFLELMELILSVEGFRNTPFIERLADALVVWDKPFLALAYYKKALDSLGYQKPGVARRIQKKMDGINALNERA